ncbi:glucose 1-dehydrogenase [Herbaspirillum autotrophicum]|uniref:glucose 1-dehydrogenase n=1 Tax=Herbaspirillum autotrophicum TaxID=180195 RepID=UPI00067DA631|nr:glucose 1-dehydrogenase [Herbaspirillum autotrophicum]
MTITPNPLLDLTGKIALINGGSRGIGLSIAKAFAANGAHVIIASRKQEACNQAVAAIVAAGGSAQAHACHIGDTAQIEALFAAIGEQHGRLDILVNNAAANPYQGPIVETSLSVYEKTMDVNVRGYFFSCVHGTRLMALHGAGGSIINVASVNGIMPGMGQGIYSVSKAAVLSMTLAFAQECIGSGIRVNALVPGPTETRFAAPVLQDPEAMQALLPRLPMGRLGQPDEMAGAALYLASSASSYTNGASITVDGGFLLA